MLLLRAAMIFHIISQSFDVSLRISCSPFYFSAILLKNYMVDQLSLYSVGREIYKNSLSVFSNFYGYFALISLLRISVS